MPYEFLTREEHRLRLFADRVGEGDAFGRIYEYFLGKFASAEGKNSGEFYTPRSIVRLQERGQPVTVGNLPTMYVRVDAGQRRTAAGRLAALIRFAEEAADTTA